MVKALATSFTQHRLTSDGAIAVHRLDRFVGAVTGGLRGELGQ